MLNKKSREGHNHKPQQPIYNTKRKKNKSHKVKHMKVYFLFVAHVTICYIIPIVLEIKHARQYYICNNAILDKGETMTFFESKNVYAEGQNISDKRFHLVMILPINSHRL